MRSRGQANGGDRETIVYIYVPLLKKKIFGSFGCVQSSKRTGKKVKFVGALA